MSRRLPSPDSRPRYPLPFPVNIFGPDDLAGFRALPRPWQRATLRTCGGSGEETAEALTLALSARPARPEIIQIADDIETKRGGSRSRLLRTSERLRRLSERQEAVIARAADEALTWKDDLHAWQESQPLRPLAERVAERCRDLAAVDAGALRLLTASDDDLLSEAERMADAAQARHEAKLAAGHPGIHPRERDARSIRRRLRRRVGRAAAHASGILQLVGGRPSLRRPAYADAWSLRRWRQVRENGQKFLSEHVAMSPAGDTVSMLEIANSAAGARQAMWYSIILGMRDRARRDGRVPVFVTGTLPTEYHPNPSKGARSYNPTLSPTDAARELAKRWHWALCMLRESGVRPYGVRTVEPHEDGCPHMHACVWIKPDDVDAVKKAMGRHFPATTAKETAARKSGDFTEGPALTVKEWEQRDDKTAADPASYVMWYVLKSINAGGGDDDDDDDDDRDDSDRAQAWASHVGLRRLSLIGLAPGTLGRWRAVHRAMRSADREGERIACPRARAIAHAMRRRQWASVLLLLGALSTSPRLASVREERIDGWGDVVKWTSAYHHPSTGEVVAETRPMQWVIVRPGPDSLSIRVSSPRESASPPPAPPRAAAASPP